MATVTTATATLGLNLTLASLERSYDIDLTLNVFRRHESILYRSRDTIQAANVAFFASKAVISTSALNIHDRSTVLAANRIESLDEPVSIENEQEYDVPTDKFVVTDIYAADDNSNQSTALFYEHVLSTTNLPRVSSLDDLTIHPNWKLTSIEVIDINFNPIQLDSIKVNYDTGLVYNNLTSSYDQETGVAVIYYLRYSVKNITTGTIVSYTELVSNRPIFKPAEFSDLDESLEIIDDGRTVYLIEEQEDYFIVRLPHVGNYSFQLLEDARIRLVPPPQSDVNDIWNILVTNGKFFTTIGSTTYKYSIGEFINQDWNPEQPYKLASSEEAEVISDNLVKVRRENVFSDPTVSGFIDLLVYDSDEVPVAAFTTDPSKEDTISDNSKPFEYWSNIAKVGIRSVDNKIGIIDLDGIQLRSDYKLVATYNYEETNYDFTAVDFNPIHNSNILTRFVSLFVDPDSNGTVKPQTLYFTVTDRSGKVVSSNLSNFDNTDQKIQTDDGLWRDCYYETIPSYITTATGAILFIPHYTVIGSGVFLPLGDIHVTEDSHPDQATIIDTRIRGGGIKESEIEEAKELQHEVEWYWDLGFWDGTPYPGTASYFIEVPAEILEVAGGDLTAGEIRGVIDRHTAAGVYAITKAYGIDPVISGVIPGSGVITIKWSSYS